MNIATSIYTANLRSDRLLRLETALINKKFEERQKKLEKYVPEEELIEGKVEELLNKSANGIILADDELKYLNENTFKPKGYVFDKYGNLIKLETEKEFWQMTREEFDKYDFVGIAKDVEVGNEYKSVDGNTYKITNKDIAGLGVYFNFIDKNTNEKFSGNIRELRKKIYGAVNHYGIINKALSEGKDVPENVLSEYPELKKETSTTNEYKEKTEQLIENYAWQLAKVSGGDVESYKNYGRKLIEKIDAKDYKGLHDVLYSHNKASKKLFSDYTGIKLPPTDKGTFEILRQFTGYIEPEKIEMPKLSKEEIIKKIQKAKADKALEVKINYTNIGILTKREFIENMINAGYRPLIREYGKVKEEKGDYIIKNEEAKNRFKSLYGDNINFFNKYILEKDNSIWDINKSEYDYAISLYNEKQIKSES